MNENSVGRGGMDFRFGIWREWFGPGETSRDFFAPCRRDEEPIKDRQRRDRSLNGEGFNVGEIR